MKALRNQNIVHRDLKPGNILIKKHPHTGKMMVSAVRSLLFLFPYMEVRFLQSVVPLSLYGSEVPALVANCRSVYVLARGTDQHVITSSSCCVGVQSSGSSFVSLGRSSWQTLGLPATLEMRGRNQLT